MTVFSIKTKETEKYKKHLIEVEIELSENVSTVATAIKGFSTTEEKIVFSFESLRHTDGEVKDIHNDDEKYKVYNHTYIDKEIEKNDIKEIINEINNQFDKAKEIIDDNIEDKMREDYIEQKDDWNNFTKD